MMEQWEGKNLGSKDWIRSLVITVDPLRSQRRRLHLSEADHSIITSFSKETPTHRIKAYATLLSSAETETRVIETDRTVEGNRHPQLTYLAHPSSNPKNHEGHLRTHQPKDHSLEMKHESDNNNGSKQARSRA